MNKERKEGLAHAARIAKRMVIIDKLKENQKVWLVAGLTTSTIGLVLALRYYAKERAKNEGFKNSLEEIAEGIEESSSHLSQNLGEAAILAIAPEVAQDFEDLRGKPGGREFLRWLGKICGLSTSQRGTKEDTEKQIIFASTQAGERVVKPEIEKEGLPESPTTQSGS